MLELVVRDGARSRIAVARETGLDRSTVSSLANELIARRLLRETDVSEHPGRIGRPARLVEADRDGVAAIGLEVNVDYLAACAVDLLGEVRAERRIEVDCAGAEPAGVIGQVAAFARELGTQLARSATQLLGVTLALPGLVDIESGHLSIAPNLGWRGVPAGALLRQAIGARAPRLGVPVAVDNEANLAALAEHWNGAAALTRDVVCVTGAVGIGAGVIIGGQLLRGSHGFGGELGHVTVDPGGRLCACGARGCLETVAGSQVVMERAGIALTPEHASVELLVRARASEPNALAALTEAGAALGIALASIVNVLDPEAIVLGGWMTPFSSWLLPAVRAELERRVLAFGRGGRCELRTAQHGAQAAVRGGAIAGLHAVLADPTLAAIA